MSTYLGFNNFGCMGPEVLSTTLARPVIALLFQIEKDMKRGSEPGPHYGTFFDSEVFEKAHCILPYTLEAFKACVPEILRDAPDTYFNSIMEYLSRWSQGSFDCARDFIRFGALNRVGAWVT